MSRQRPGSDIPRRGGDSKQRFEEPVRHTAPAARNQVTNRSLTLGHLRAVWWSQWREGHRLPAELGVIVILGGLKR